MGLAKKAAKGLFWVALSTIFVRAVGFIAKIILARLLAPEDFGLLAIGLLTINTVGIFKDLGLGAALIHRKEDIEKAADTAFLIIPIFATVLFALAFFSASFVASFFENQSAMAIIRVLAFTLVISSFGTVPSNLLEKELEFKKKVIPEALPQVGYALVAITLALLGYGVWSLVWGQVVSALVGTILIWFFIDWRPKFRFDKTIAKELFGYGKQLIAASIIIFIYTNFDDALVGKMLGVTSLGYYALAYTISNAPTTHITHLVHRVAFPAYSKIQDDVERLKNAYLKILKLVSTLSFPLATGIFLVSPNFVHTVLGEKWVPAIPVLQILCVYGLTRSIAATTGSLFNSAGKPEYLKKTSLITLLIGGVLIYPLTITYNLIGVGIAVVLSHIIGTTCALFLTRKLIRCTYLDIANSLGHPFLGTLVMTVGIILINSFAFRAANLTHFTLMSLDITIGVFIYLSYIIIFNKDSLISLLVLLKRETA